MIITKQEEFVTANAKGEELGKICEDVLKVLRHTLDTNLSISVDPKIQTAPPMKKVCWKAMSPLSPQVWDTV